MPFINSPALPKTRLWHSATLLLFFVAVFVSFRRIWRPHQNDYAVYLRAAQQMRDTLPVYDLSGATPYVFRYPPITWWIFRPLASYSETVARSGWFILQSIGFAAALALTYRMVQPITKRAPEILFGASLLLFRFFLDAHFSGQIFGIMAITWVGGLFLAMNSRPFIAGFVLALPTALKIGPGLSALLLLIYFVRTPQHAWRNSIRFLSGVLTFGIVGSALTALATSVHDSPRTLWSEWITSMGVSSGAFDGGTTRSQSFRAFAIRIARWLGSDFTQYEIYWAGFVLVAVGFFVVRWSRLRLNAPGVLRQEFAVSMIACTLLMPEALPYWFASLTLPIALLLAFAVSPGTSGRSAARAALVAFVLFCALPGTDIVGISAMNWILRMNLPFFCLLGLAFVLGAHRHQSFDGQK